MSHDPLITRSDDQVANKKTYIFTFTRPMATNHDRDLAFHEKILSIKSDNPLITWAHQVTWEMKNAMSPFSRDLLPPNFPAW